MPSIFLITALAMLCVFLTHSLILAYHWFRYSLNAKVALLWLFVYLGGGLLLLFFLIGAGFALS